jgi:hypothetical protein
VVGWGQMLGQEGKTWFTDMMTQRRVKKEKKKKKIDAT